MAGEDDKVSIELSGEELRTLSMDNLRELQERFGLEISIHSTRTAIDTILRDIGREGGGLTAEFTRGFDRTSPGYDRYYNRDIPTSLPGEEIVLPPVQP
ncbi:hypothetical protein ABZ860_41535 [Microbispora sp. NPDC046973]|uniref:hypothetical protein n=1 Tax=Microbispora sp. NPDC046973 TaxID=3155022 RepID=UPI0033D8DED2